MFAEFVKWPRAKSNLRVSESVFSKMLKNLVVAGGHGMMGVSLATATGKLVAQLAQGEKLATDISMYSAERFIS